MAGRTCGWVRSQRSQNEWNTQRMAVRRLKDDDILGTATLYATGEGLHEMGGRTSLFLIDDRGEPPTEMVSNHEMAHANLNRTTIYGDLLQSVANSLNPRSDSDRDRLADLVDAAKRTHECFATSWGVWLTRGDPDALLAGYPAAYSECLSVARKLTTGLPDNSLGGLVVIESVARAAMQAPIRELLVGPDSLAGVSLGDLPVAYRPDERFRVLIESGCDFTAPLDDIELWRLPLDSDSVTPKQLEGDEVARTHAELAAAVFSICAALLSDAAGFPTADFKAQMDGMPSSTRAARRTRLEEGKPMLLGYAAHERVHLRNDRPELSVLPLEPWLDFALDWPAHVLVTRPTARILEQYSLSEESRQRLLAADSHGFVTGIRYGLGPVRGSSVLLVVIDTPPKARAIGEKLASISNVSMTALGSAWRDEWWPELPSQTLLIDIHPFAATDILKKIFEAEKESGSVACAGWRIQRNADNTNVTGAYVRLSSQFDVAHPGLIAIAVATTPVSLQLCEFWCETSTLAARQDDPLHARSALFAELLGNLAEEEPWFDFAAPLPEAPAGWSD
jgi:hypothetical protein